MLINETSKMTNLTKKAIEYYTLQGLVSPSVLENGYSDYSRSDIDILIKISILRKLDIGIDEIRYILLDKSNRALQEASIKIVLEQQRNLIKNDILNRLGNGESYEEISKDIEAIDLNKNISEKILEVFPGYYGRFICMHFSRFLNEPARCEIQENAYNRIVDFLDNLPPFDIPKDLEEYIDECTGSIGTFQISKMLESIQETISNPNEFLENKKELIEEYLKFTQSDEYKKSPAYKMMEIMKNFNSSNGYNDIFIPAMKELSSSYAEYYSSLEKANEKFLAQYPEVKNNR